MLKPTFVYQGGPGAAFEGGGWVTGFGGTEIFKAGLKGGIEVVCCGARKGFAIFTKKRDFSYVFFGGRCEGGPWGAAGKKNGFKKKRARRAPRAVNGGGRGAFYADFGRKKNTNYASSVVRRLTGGGGAAFFPACARVGFFVGLGGAQNGAQSGRGARGSWRRKNLGHGHWGGGKPTKKEVFFPPKRQNNPGRLSTTLRWGGPGVGAGGAAYDKGGGRRGGTTNQHLP